MSAELELTELVAMHLVGSVGELPPRPLVAHRVIDAALGVVEKGWYHNDDAYGEQPWLPIGPIPHTITWTRPGYEAPGVAHPGTGGRT